MDDELLLQKSSNICTICIEPVQIDSIYFKCTNCNQTNHFECLLLFCPYQVQNSEHF